MMTITKNERKLPIAENPAYDLQSLQVSDTVLHVEASAHRLT